MKNYLDLIPISAKVYRKQNRMTRLCIVFAVFLVTVIFSMADMEIRSQKLQAIQSDGSWHANFMQIDDGQASFVAARPEVTNFSWYGALNYGLDLGYQIEGVETVICGFDEAFLEMFPFQKIVEGEYPQDADSAVVTKSVKDRLNISVGDSIILRVPDGSLRNIRVSGFSGNTSMLTDHDAFGMFLSMDGYKKLAGLTSSDQKGLCFYVQFNERCNIQKTLEDICIQTGLDQDQIAQNTKLLALMFQSNDSYMIKLYLTAAVLAVLVTAAGILMIAASLNSSISRRTEFFGMLRCLGATRKQVARFVIREALSWCRTAVPAGIIPAMIVVWGLCFMLRTLSPGLFSELPVLGISWYGIIAGALVGVLTVLLAARAPAKKAAKVSPLMAISGNAGTVREIKNAANTAIFRVETALGVHHAKGSGKNLALMTGSFAFSIILFLAFSTAIDFMHHALTPLQPYTPDISLSCSEGTLSAGIAEELAAFSEVKKVFGRQIQAQIPASVNGEETIVNLVSYENNQFGWSADLLLDGSLESAEQGNAVLAVYRPDGILSVGDTIRMAAESGEWEMEVAGVLSNSPYSSDMPGETLICSEDLFQALTGKQGYSVIDLQLNASAEDTFAEKVRAVAGEDVNLSDQRISNQETKGAYYSFALFLYGFLVIIGLIAIFNIVNSIAMSVSARMKEYGIMRALGMSKRQVVRMIEGEGMTYAVLGILFGCTIGLPVNHLLFGYLVTARWGDPWRLPGIELGIILCVVIAALGLAVRGPAREIGKMTVVDIIGER